MYLPRTAVLIRNRPTHQVVSLRTSIDTAGATAVGPAGIAPELAGFLVAAAQTAGAATDKLFSTFFRGNVRVAGDEGLFATSLEWNVGGVENGREAQWVQTHSA